MSEEQVSIMDKLEGIFGPGIKVPTFVLLVQPEGNLNFRIEVLAGFNDRRKDLPVSPYEEFIKQYTDFIAMVCQGSREEKLEEFTTRKNDPSSKKASTTPKESEN
ncbi:MAG: hypothetical protein ACFFD4_07995 [Candidatus Odinarchaeota archaeon]